MLDARAHIPVAACEIEAGSQVERVAIDLRARESRIARVVQVEFRAVERLAQQSALHADAHRSAEQPQFHGVLRLQSLMRKHTDMVVHHHRTHAVIRFHRVERDVGTRVGRLRIARETRHAQRVGSGHVQHRPLAHGSRVVRRFHVKIMTERGIVLRTNPRADRRQH